MNTQQPSRPVITPAMREQAVKQPNTWLYVVDPIFTDPNAEVPPWGFIGGYRVDERGELTDDFSPNPNYRPSPVALRLPAPANDLERALQLTTTGYAHGYALLSALLDSELILFSQPQGSGLFTVEHESGRRQLQVFTSESYLPPKWSSWQRMTGRQLAGHQLAGIDVQINPASVVKARIPGEDLLKAAALPAANGEPVTLDPSAPPPQSAPAPPPGTSPEATANGQSASVAPPDFTQPVPPRVTKAAEPDDAGQTESNLPDATQPVPQESSPAETELGRRFVSSMLAGAIGDALGSAVEFYPIDQIRSRFGEQGIADYDRNSERPGEFTDDTQMSLFTLEGLIRGHIATRRSKADTPLPSVQLAYQRWLHTQGYAWSRAAGPFADEHPDPTGWLIKQRGLFVVRSPNSSCITALREFASVGEPGTFEHTINDSQDCGGVVRCAPVALWSDDPREVFELGAATAALTYSHPNGYLPAGVLAALVQQLLRGESLDSALSTARELLTSCAGHEDTDRALQAAVDLAANGKPTPERIKDTLGGGWSGHQALAIAVCAALSGESMASSLMIAVNHSGDSDSTGAICGNIVGAFYDATTLPGVWLRDLKQREMIETLATDALMEFGEQPPSNDQWFERYPGEKDTSTLAFTSRLPSAKAEPAQPPAEPITVSPSDWRARFLGCLLGGAVGDALGYPVENDSWEDIQRQHGERGLTGFVDAKRPGGSVSDDTQMTLFTLDGLIRAHIQRRLHGGTEPAHHVQHAYQRWLHTQGFDWKVAAGPAAADEPDGWLIQRKGLFVRRAPGTTTIQALHGYASGNAAGSFTDRVNDSKGCGGVMRSAPAGLWSDDASEVFRIGALTAALTHGHPSGYLPAGALAVIVQQLLRGQPLPKSVQEALTQLSAWDGHEETLAALRRAVELADQGAPKPETIHEHLGSGLFGEGALAIAVYAALSFPDSFSDAVSLAANHSGTSATTAALCGNIMGAAHTSRAIPQPWLNQLELRAVLMEIAEDAVREFSPNPPSEVEWLERYPVRSDTDSVEAETALAEPDPAEEVAAPLEEEPEPTQEPASLASSDDTLSASSDDMLSDEELRLLTAWRKFRDGADDTASDLSQGLHKLLAEAFGEERAAQLVSEATEEQETSQEPEVAATVELARESRLRGCVFGGAVGDALGAAWMFADLKAMREENPDGLRELGEVFGRRGAATVLSQQAVFVLDGLLRAAVCARLRGVDANTYPPGMVRLTLQHWLWAQGANFEPSLPAGPLTGLPALRTQRFPDEASLTALTQHREPERLPSASDPPNSARAATATARGAAVGFHAPSIEAAVSLGAEVAVVTHGHPDGYLPAGALAGLITGIVHGKSIAESVEAVLAVLDQLEGSEATAHGLRTAVAYAAENPAVPEDLEKLGTGWAGPEALAIAVCAALSHPEDFATAVALAATHSGNSSATAMICGSLLGTARGNDDIPAEWLKELELGDVLDELVADESRIEAEVEYGAPAPNWAARYVG